MIRKRTEKPKKQVLQLNRLGMVELNVTTLGISELPIDIYNFKRIESINAGNNRITFLPDPVGNLKRLQVLDLRQNFLQTLPDTLAHCDRLKYLDLSDNGMKTLPSAIRQLRNLKYLRLAGNQLRFLGEELTNATSLQFLDVSRNQLQVIPYGMQQLLRLQALDLSQNSITTLPSHICKLKQLKSLNVSGNQLSGLPAGILSWIDIKELIASHNKFTELPQQVLDLPSLTSLNFEYNQIKDIPGRLERLSHLEYLQLSHNRLGTLSYLPTTLMHLNCSDNGLHIVSVQGLRNLHYIDCSRNRLEYLPLGLVDCMAVETVLLSNNKIKEIPEEIAKMKNLRIIDLENNDLECMPAAINRIRQLQKFNIQGNKFNSREGKQYQTQQLEEGQKHHDQVSSTWLKKGRTIPTRQPSYMLENDKGLATISSVGATGSSLCSPVVIRKSKSTVDLRSSQLVPQHKVIRSPLPATRDKARDHRPTSDDATIVRRQLVTEDQSNFHSSPSQHHTHDEVDYNSTIGRVKHKESKGMSIHQPVTQEMPVKRQEMRSPNVAKTSHTHVPQTTIDDLIEQLEDESLSSCCNDLDTGDEHTVTTIGGRYKSNHSPRVYVEFPPGAVDKPYHFNIQVEAYPARILDRLQECTSMRLLDNLIWMGSIVYISSDDSLTSFRKAVSIYLPICEPKISGYVHALSFEERNCLKSPGAYEADGGYIRVNTSRFKGGIGIVITRDKSTLKAAKDTEEFLKLIYI